ncbi:hypothetical protein PoB_002410900 [Plakobranchus ocellatus]|uniref:Uncharacterized protein n=1 Tax=Plakobranchus ocellatus TaxID=259542 RepID=A0AAV3ZQK0_9GAST|nr:hypothetical protein PoB_002410900 [Plakobranchus ocellatus]
MNTYKQSVPRVDQATGQRGGGKKDSWGCGRESGRAEVGRQRMRKMEGGKTVPRKEPPWELVLSKCHLAGQEQQSKNSYLMYKLPPNSPPRRMCLRLCKITAVKTGSEYITMYA